MVDRYRAYDLVISSDVPLPELPLDNGSETPDVVVVRGVVPDRLSDARGVGLRYTTAQNRFLLRIPEVARYLVRDGVEIIVDVDPAASPNEVRSFLLGSCVGALLHQRKVLVLHAAVTFTPLGAVLFCGKSGVGKSTMLGAMVRRGHLMMVDDVCGVVAGDARAEFTVLPGFARTRLRADSASGLNIATDGLTLVRPSSDKFDHLVTESFWPSPAPMRQIYELAVHDEESILIEELSPIEAFRTVLLNTYRPAFLDGLEMRATHLELASAVASRARICRVTRPRQSFELDPLVQLIEQDLGRF